MKKKTFILIIAISIVYLAFIISLGIALTSFYRNHFNNDTGNSLLENSQHEALQLTKRLNTDYQTFLALLEERDNDNLNLDKPSIYNQKYLGFGLITDSGFIFDDGVEKLFMIGLNLDYYNQDIAIYSPRDLFQNNTEDEVYIFFRKDNRFGYFLAKTYLDDVIINEQYFLTSANGLIYFNGIENNNATNLNSYFSDSTEIISALQSNEPGYIVTDSVDGKVFSTYASLAAVTGLYFVSNIDYDLFYNHANYLSGPIVAAVIITSVIIVILSIFFSITFTSIYRDVELSFHQQSYSQIPIIKVNRKGKITYRNKQFKKEFFEFANNKYINEIFLVDMLDILKQIPLKVWLLVTAGSYNGARIISLKTSVVSYTLLIYPFFGGEIEEESTLTDSLTGIPNLNQLKLDFRNINNSLTNFTENQGLAVIKITNLRNVEMMRGQAYVEGAIFKTAHRLRTLSSKLSGVKFYHSFDNNFVLFYEARDIVSIKADIRRIIQEFDQEPFDSDYDIKFYLRAGLYPFNAKTERSSALFIYEKAKLACENLDAKEDSILSVYDGADDVKMQRSHQMARDLDDGITNNEFKMYLQAQYDLDQEKIIGFEALLRWNNPKYMRVSPSVYIELAEQSNSILRLGKLIIDETVKLAKQLEKYDLTISVNVSPLQIIQVGFVNAFKETIAEYGVDPKKIIIEVTETTLISFFSDVIEKIKALQEFGIKVHIDDFGTGNSSLLYLKEIPVDALKIDRGFIQNILTDRYSKAIVGMVVNLAKNLDIELITEGVETSQQADYLHKRGVRYIQGYYISKPLPINEAITLIDNSTAVHKKGE